LASGRTTLDDENRPGRPVNASITIGVQGILMNKPVNVVFPEIGTKLLRSPPHNGLKNLILHMDNVPCDNSRQTMMEIGIRKNHASTI
jgi:hypothetical protein